MATSKVGRPVAKRKLPSSLAAHRDGYCPADPKMDRRVRRTRDVLGDALVALMHEKPFNTITVQHVLDRAGVGRSTFYSHFRDKDDLFLSDAEDFFEMMSSLLARRGERSKRVAPVREFFAHVAEWHQFYSAMVASEKIRDVMELGQGYFARAIDQRLAALAPTRSMPPTRRSALSHAFAGALFSLLDWWINHSTPSSAIEMDHLFHQMVWSGTHGHTHTQPSNLPQSTLGKLTSPPCSSSQRRGMVSVSKTRALEQKGLAGKSGHKMISFDKNPTS